MIDTFKQFLKRARTHLLYDDVILSTSTNVAKNSVFEGHNSIGANSSFSGQVGYGSYIGSHCEISAQIGRFSSISDNVNVIIGNHPTSGFATTCPLFYSLKNQSGPTFVSRQKYVETQYADFENRYGIIVGNDVWIGFGAKILSGIRIGDGAVIGACALVTRDVNPYSIVVGQPAKVIKKRFDDDTIQRLITTHWWKMPLPWIMEHADEFENVDKLLSTLESSQSCNGSS